MKILFDFSVNAIGGAVQNAVNFILISLDDKDFHGIYAVTPQIYELLGKYRVINDSVFVVRHPLRGGWKDLKKIESDFDPDIVYTMAGPSYFKFKNRHVVGISDGYITHANFRDFFYNRSIKSGGVMLFKSILKGLSARCEGDFFIFQTETARLGFCSRYLLPQVRTAVVPNSIGVAFSSYRPGAFSWMDSSRKEVRIFCPGANYPHKDLNILLGIANDFKKNDFPFSVVCTVTIPQDSDLSDKLIKASSDSFKIINIGPYSYSDALALYEASDIVFIPSVLETFSTAYIEAIYVGKYLLVSNKPFSREICEEAAVYFEAGNVSSAISKIVDIVSDPQKKDAEVRSAVLSKYGMYAERYEGILSCLKKFSRR